MVSEGRACDAEAAQHSDQQNRAAYPGSIVPVANQCVDQPAANKNVDDAGEEPGHTRSPHRMASVRCSPATA